MNAPRWSNWSGTAHCSPRSMSTPTTVDEIVKIVSQAKDAGDQVSTRGAGHSFTACAVTDGIFLSLDDMSGIESITPLLDGNAKPSGALVTIWAGTRLHDIAPLLWELGLSMPNLGDFAQQSIAGATATGTHGTGLHWPSTSATIRGLQLITADGQVRDCSPTHNAELFYAARLSVGALGVISKITVECVPSFVLDAQETPEKLSSILSDIEGFAISADHAEFFWFPHTNNVLSKRNSRLPGDTSLSRRGSIKTYLDDELLPNEAFEVACKTCRKWPAITPRVNAVTSRIQSGRSYSNRSYSVFAASRRVRFYEMEYAVPIEAAATLLSDLDRLITKHNFPLPFPIEVRFSPAEDTWLAGSYGRETCHIAVHQYTGMPYRDIFELIEPLFVAADGRPHWGKLHTRQADELRASYPRFDDFLAVRNAVDPDRMFGNNYRRGIFGE